MNASLFSSSQESLNLTRKLRPRTFDQIVGQEMAVRMIKNSLYVNKLFPVYLLAGQRGCGKTTTARVFASAVNCAALEQFRKQPSLPFPCLQCDSCVAMLAGAHPDFIEIDAASNTGVDNVRQIIETAAYVPVSGVKKVYLIDEAHMLSKAAFNAFLKLLEEPPRSVIFMLATTELHKIPQTVLSRCFQISFGPLESQALLRHLQEICQLESIDATEEALQVIIGETEGSARDAINLLEQVRFQQSSITVESILAALGKLGTAQLLEITECIVAEQPQELLAALARLGESAVNPSKLWESLVDIIKAITWLKHGATAVPQSLQSSSAQLQEIAQRCSKNRLLAMLQLLWEQEKIFLQTSKKQAFLEFLLLQLASQTNIGDLRALLDGAIAPRPVLREIPAAPYATTPAPQQEPTVATRPVPTPQQPVPAEAPLQSGPVQASDEWLQFVQTIADKTNDAMLHAIFSQSICEESAQQGTFILKLKKKSKFFTDKLDESAALWQPILRSFHPSFVKLVIEEQPATAAPTPATTTVQPRSSVTPPQRPAASYTPAPRTSVTGSQRQGNAREEYLTVNAEQWPFASLLIEHFPGRIKKINNFS